MMKKLFSMAIAAVMLLALAIPAAAAYNDYGYYQNYDPYYANPYQSYDTYQTVYPYQTVNSYYGENYQNTNYSTYGGNYYMSAWAQDLQAAYDPTWYEQPQRTVLRGEAFLLYLRAVQHSLDRQGYTRLSAGYNRAPFSDYGSVNPYAQSEVNVLYSNGILIGYPDNTMRFSQTLTRAEMAAIYSRFNRIFFNMGVGYSQNTYNGYNSYYNNNYGSYYNNYTFQDTFGHWAQQDITTAASNGVFQGVGNGYFDTEGPLTIEQIWAMLDRCVGYQGLKRADIAYAMSQTFKVRFGNRLDESYSTVNGTKITRLTAATTSMTINQGETRNIKVTISPSDAQYQKLSWTSADTRYVSIEEAWNPSKGLAYVSVYGRMPTSNYITLTGRAMDGSGLSVTVRVKVNSDNDYDDDDYITSLTASESTIYLNPGQSKQVNVRIFPTGAANKNIAWSSQNTNIAYVTNDYLSGSNAYVTIVGNAEGSTYVYARALDGSGEEESIRVVVQRNSQSTNVPITSVSASPSSVSLNVGDSRNVNFTIYPTNATNRNISWVSDNERVAVVNVTSSGQIQIVGVGTGTTNVRGIAQDTGSTVCVIPVTVTGNVPGITDNTPPRVTLEGATSVNIGETITIIAKATDDTNLSSFNITVNDIIGMTGSLSPVKVEKISNTEYRITLMGVEVASQCICIAGGVAQDAAGNSSYESNEIVIFVNSGE